MSSTEGALDPVFGQRAAFPAGDADSDAAKYLESVRKEAEALLVDGMAQSTSPRQQPKKRPRIEQRPELDYDELSPAKVASYAKMALGCEIDATTVDETLKVARTASKSLQKTRPDCDSRAKWRSYVWSHKPVPLDHEDVIRLLKYMPKWAQAPADADLGLWTFALLLQLHDVLEADDIAVVRDAVRSINDLDDKLLVRIIKRLAALQWGQSDL